MHLLDNPANAVKKAFDAGVKRILTHGLDPASNLESLALAKKFPVVEACLGMYPTDAVLLPDDKISHELNLIKNISPVAIGEVGLDYHTDVSDKVRMKNIFSDVLSLAEKIRRPVIVHSRKAESDVIDMLSSFNVRADLHCFGGSLKLARKAADMGLYFSIPTNIVRATHFQRLVEETPISLLLTETDSPFLSPDDKPNEPANIPLAVNKIAGIKELLIDECTNILWLNQSRFLR